jgi:hypothetical protein
MAAKEKDFFMAYLIKYGQIYVFSGNMYEKDVEMWRCGDVEM